MYLGLSFILIHQQCILFWIGFEYCFETHSDKSWGKIKLVLEIHLVCGNLQYTKTLLVTNQESLKPSLYTFEPMCRNIFKSPCGKLPNLLGMKLTAAVTLQFLSAMNNDPSRHKTSSRHLGIVFELSCLDNTFSRYLQDILELSCLDNTFSRYLQDIFM